MSSLWLSDKELCEFTGIYRKKRGIERKNLHIEWLNKKKIPFHENDAGKIKVARALFTFSIEPVDKHKGWEPRAV